MKFKLLVEIDEVTTSVAKIDIDDKILDMLQDNATKADYIGNEIKAYIEHILAIDYNAEIPLDVKRLSI